MSAKCHRLSLSRKRKRNASCPQVELVDVGEDLNSVSNDVVSSNVATLSEMHTPLYKGNSERVDNASPPPRTVSSEQVDCEHTGCSTNSDGESSSVKKRDDYGTDDFEIYSQDWRVWNPHSVSENSILSKKQTNLRSFFSYTPAAQRKLHPTSITRGRSGSQQESKSSNAHRKVILETSQSSKPAEICSDDGVNVKSQMISPDTSHLVLSTASLPTDLDIGMITVNHSARPRKGVGSREPVPSSSQQLGPNQSGGIASTRRKVCPQYKWIPGMWILFDNAELRICVSDSNLASPTVQVLWVWLCDTITPTQMITCSIQSLAKEMHLCLKDLLMFALNAAEPWYR